MSKAKEIMTIYLIQILTNNDAKEIMNSNLEELMKKYDAVIMLADLIDAKNNVLINIVFDNKEERDLFADAIPQIAFKYEDRKYPKELWEQHTGKEVIN